VLLATIAACSVDPGPSNLPPLDASADGTCTSGGSLRPNEAIHFDGIGDYALMGTAGLPFSSTRGPYHFGIGPLRTVGRRPWSPCDTTLRAASPSECAMGHSESFHFIPWGKTYCRDV